MSTKIIKLITFALCGIGLIFTATVSGDFIPYDSLPAGGELHVSAFVNINDTALPFGGVLRTEPKFTTYTTLSFGGVAEVTGQIQLGIVNQNNINYFLIAPALVFIFLGCMILAFRRKNNDGR